MLGSAFRGKEVTKMFILTFSLESEMLHNFQVNFSNMIGIAIFKVADDLRRANVLLKSSLVLLQYR